MRTAIRIAGIASLFATPVLAADLPVKATPPVVASGWTGFYVGGNLGVGIGRVRAQIQRRSRRSGRSLRPWASSFS